MCSNKRATFARVAIEDNGTTEVFDSITIKRRTTVLTTLGVIMTLLLGMLTLRGAIINGIRGVAKQEFKEELGTFHAVAKPEIKHDIDTAIELHRRSGVHPGGLTEAQIKDMINELKVQNSNTQTQVNTLITNEAHQTELLEELLRKVD